DGNTSAAPTRFGRFIARHFHADRETNRLTEIGVIQLTIPKMGLEEALALTPALSPRRGGSVHVPGNFHAFWCGTASWDSRRPPTLPSRLCDLCDLLRPINP